MNALVPKSPPTQIYFSAREMAEIALKRGITTFPTTEFRAREYAKRAGWNDLGVKMCRKRAGRGGGLEYHFTLMPNCLRLALEAGEIRDQLATRHQADRAVDAQKLNALKQSQLRPHAKTVQEARAHVLSTITGYAIARGEMRAWAIKRFLKAQAAVVERQEIEAKRDRGEILTAYELHSLGQPLDLTSDVGFGLSLDMIRKANDRPTGKFSIGRTALYDWFKLHDEQGVVALAPESTKKAQPIPAEFSEFLRFYAVGSKRDVPDAHVDYLKDAERRGVVAPLTVHQVRRILREKLNNIEKHVGREGLLTLRSRMAYVSRSTEDLWPTTVYTADGKTFDAEIADMGTGLPIRPEITTVLDVATRKVVGHSLSRAENTVSVAAALRSSCVEFGIPAMFYVDRGAGFKAHAIDAPTVGLMGRLGITKMHALPYNSQGKGLVERPNATIWDTLAKRLPTYVGDKMDKEAAKRAHKQTRSDIQQFGHSRLLPSWDEFVEMCKARISEYNRTPHSALPKFVDPTTGRKRHMSPDEAWDMHVARGVDLITVHQDEVDDLFRPYEVRTARRALVSLNGNEYFDMALEPYHEMKVAVGYDYNQADRVWVREFDHRADQPGRLICVARFAGNEQRYVPVTAQRAAEEQRAKARLKRLGRKVEAVEAELNAPYLLDHHETMPIPDLDLRAEPVPVQEVVQIVANEPEAPAAPARRRFKNDVEFAAYALANPDKLTPNQKIALQRCVKGPATRQYLETSGIDTEALRTLLRAVA